MKTIAKKIFVFLVTASFTLQASMFVLPESLKPQVDFWTKIYSFYDTHQVVLHDRFEPMAIYHVIELPKIPNELSAPKFKDQVEKKLKSLSTDLELLTSEKRPQKLSSEQAKLDEVIKKFNLTKVTDLASRVRAQSGLKSQFAMGLKTSGRYVDEVKAVLKSQGLPTDLVAMVFVESLWNLTAVSHAGASGPWGIVKETAVRSGIHVNKFTDERLDPVLATLGAANYLKKAKEGLGEWSLAITSYNYGYNGMLRAVSGLETKKIDVIIDKHESPIFGYAVKNYYAEFLAAMHVYDNHEKYFPGLTKDQPWNYDLVTIERPLNVKDLLASNAVSKDSLAGLNPSLSKDTVNGSEVIPPGYSLRVPKGKSKHFYEKLKTVPAPKREQAKWVISTRHKAKGNESLDAITRKYGLIDGFLSEKLGQAGSYKPKGVINIRSYGYKFSKLGELTKDILAALTP